MRVAMGEDEQQGRSNPGLLSDVCEAVIAALYLDGGLPAAKQFIAAAWTARIEADREAPSDPKTELQEGAQARGLPLPRYSEVDRRGPPTAQSSEERRVGNEVVSMCRSRVYRV